MSARPASPIGVVPAAGRSIRMGTSKALLPWPTPAGEVPVVCAAVGAIAPVCARVVVVVAREDVAVERALDGCGAELVRVEGREAPMFESVRAGLRRARELDAGAPCVLMPGDHPSVARATLDVLLSAHAASPERAIMPEHAGRGGHPAIVPAGLVDEIIAWGGEGGLREFWRARPGRVLRVETADPWVIADLDTPAEYASWRALAGGAERASGAKRGGGATMLHGPRTAAARRT